MRINLKSGLDIALAGEPEQAIYDGNGVSAVALLGSDHIGMNPRLSVQQGDRVRAGQPLFTDRKHPEIRFTAPSSGRVLAIHRGERRRLLSVVIEVDDAEPISFEAFGRDGIARLGAPRIRMQLLESGLWTALRARPFERVPAPDVEPVAIFVTALDTNPLAAHADVVIAEKAVEFAAGVEVLAALWEKIYICRSPSLGLPVFDERVQVVDCIGPHPAGLPGTHIGRLVTVSETQPALHIGYQDVIAIGHLFLTGQLSSERVVAIGGPAALRPRLLRTRLGASLDELLASETRADASIVSGSVLSGRAVLPPTAFLGRYDTQICVLEGLPGPTEVSNAAHRGMAAELRPRAMLPAESFEQVWPFATPVNALLRALLLGDLDLARALGCLALAEEDFAACAFVCPAAQDYPRALREVLEQLDAEHAA